MKRILFILFFFVGTIAFAGNKIPKKLRQAYNGSIPEYSLEMNESILIVEKTALSVELNKTHALVKFGSVSYNLKIEDLKRKKSIYTFHFNFPEDTKIGRIEMSLNKKTKTIQVTGPGVVPDTELR